MRVIRKEPALGLNTMPHGLPPQRYPRPHMRTALSGQQHWGTACTQRTAPVSARTGCRIKTHATDDNTQRALITAARSFAAVAHGAPIGTTRACVTWAARAALRCGRRCRARFEGPDPTHSLLGPRLDVGGVAVVSTLLCTHKHSELDGGCAVRAGPRGAFCAKGTWNVRGAAAHIDRRAFTRRPAFVRAYEVRPATLLCKLLQLQSTYEPLPLTTPLPARPQGIPARL